MSEAPSTQASLLDPAARSRRRAGLGRVHRGLWSSGAPTCADDAGFKTPTPRTWSRMFFARSPGRFDRYDPDPNRGSFRGWLSRIASQPDHQPADRAKAAPPWQRRHRHAAPAGRATRTCRDEESVLFEAEYRRGLLAWAAERVRGSFSEAVWQAFWQTGVEGRPVAKWRSRWGCRSAQSISTRAGLWCGYVARSSSLTAIRESSFDQGAIQWYGASVPAAMNRD